jgi:hypothetical protein
VNTNEVPGEAGAMAQYRELVLSVPESSTSTSFVQVQFPEVIGLFPLCAVFVVKNAKRMSP